MEAQLEKVYAAEVSEKVMDSTSVQIKDVEPESDCHSNAQQCHRKYKGNLCKMFLQSANNIRLSLNSCTQTETLQVEHRVAPIFLNGRRDKYCVLVREYDSKHLEQNPLICNFSFSMESECNATEVIMHFNNKNLFNLFQ